MVFTVNYLLFQEFLKLMYKPIRNNIDKRIQKK